MIVINVEIEDRRFEADLKPVFEKAMECGLNLWDTAAVYGEGTGVHTLQEWEKEM